MTAQQRRDRVLLEKLVTERAGASVVGSVSHAVDKLADEIAREALADEDFKRVLHEMVGRRTRELLEALLRPEEDNGHA